MTARDVRDEGFDDFLDALADGEGFYLECENGHGWLPPRRVCPTCGSRELAEKPLAETGTIDTFTVMHVAAPEFEDDTPYVTAVADFGPVRLTGQMRGRDGDPDAVEVEVEVGMEVEATVGESATTGERILLFGRR